MAYQRCFLVTLLLDNVCKRQVIHNDMTQKSITYGNSSCMLCHLCQTAVPLTCGISVSLATFSVSVMDVLALLSRFITYNLFTIEVWPLCLFIALNNSLAINMIQNDVLHQGL